MFSTALSDSQRQAIEKYLKVRYGLGIDPPTISPASGFYAGALQSVTITGDPGTQQYYTIDGQVPVVGHSDTHLYTTPLIVTTPTQVQAISVSFNAHKLSIQFIHRAGSYRPKCPHIRTCIMAAQRSVFDDIRVQRLALARHVRHRGRDAIDNGTTNRSWLQAPLMDTRQLASRPAIPATCRLI